jgi:hypothetical protein
MDCEAGGAIKMDANQGHVSETVVSQQAEFLEHLLSMQMKRLQPKRAKNEYAAFALKIISTILAVSITVVLGLNFGVPGHADLSNVALVLGALLSVVSAVDAFFNPKATWVRDTASLHHNLTIRADLEYLKAGQEDEITSEQLNKLYDRYHQVMIELDESWLSSLDQATGQGSGARPAAAP